MIKTYYIACYAIKPVVEGNTFALWCFCHHDGHLHRGRAFAMASLVRGEAN